MHAKTKQSKSKQPSFIIGLKQDPDFHYCQMFSKQLHYVTYKEYRASQLTREKDNWQITTRQ